MNFFKSISIQNFSWSYNNHFLNLRLKREDRDHLYSKIPIKFSIYSSFNEDNKLVYSVVNNTILYNPFKEPLIKNIDNINTTISHIRFFVNSLYHSIVLNDVDYFDDNSYYYHLNKECYLKYIAVVLSKDKDEQKFLSTDALKNLNKYISHMRIVYSSLFTTSNNVLETHFDLAE